MSPLERAIAEINDAYNKAPKSDLYGYGLSEARAICQRILSEEKPVANTTLFCKHCNRFITPFDENDRTCATCSNVLESRMPENKPVEHKKKWEISDSQSVYQKDGYEPFAVDQGIIYFKRPCE